MLRVMEAIPRVPRLTTASTSPIAAKQRSIEPQPPHLASKHSVQEALRIGFAIQKALSLACHQARGVSNAWILACISC